MGAKIHCVVGGQFGSEAKGAVAAFLSTQIDGPVVGIRVGGPNAGHTVIGACPSSCNDGEHLRAFKTDGSRQGTHPWRLRQVPVLAVSRPDCELVIASGSEIDTEVLLAEVDALDSAGYKVSERLMVDRYATVITDDHKAIEDGTGLTARIGSTAKGVGAARADRIMRLAPRVYDSGSVPLEWVRDTRYYIGRAASNPGVQIVIEGTQGYGLGLHTRFYPFATSGDCRAIDLLAQVGIHPWGTDGPDVHVWLVVRPNPIRVAGNSGPLLDETSWEELDLPEEQTTVTRKTRRVGGWDPELVNEAVRANGGPSDRLHLVLTMLDHKLPVIAGATAPGNLDEDTIEESHRIVEGYEETLATKVELVGTGPNTMMWYSMKGVRALANEHAFQVSIAESAREVIKMFTGFTGVDTGVDTRATEIVPTDDELTQWWINKARAEVKPMVDKALEYGGKGAAIDLVDIGRDLARMADPENAESYSVAHLTELGIAFYARGKMARIMAAVMEGRKPSDDSWYDLGIYARMAQRCRQVGGWPYGPEAEK